MCLYILLALLFLLLSIITTSSIMATRDFDALYKINFQYFSQFFLFNSIFTLKILIIFLTTWLLKAYIKSFSSDSIIVDSTVLKLRLYLILRLTLLLLPKVYVNYKYLVYLIGVIFIIYTSINSQRTINVKKFICYSSILHALVYLVGYLVIPYKELRLVLL